MKTYKTDPMLIADALDAAARVIQDSLGVTDGGHAGLFFTSPDGEKIRCILAKYAAYEQSQRDSQ